MAFAMAFESRWSRMSVSFVTAKSFVSARITNAFARRLNGQRGHEWEAFAMPREGAGCWPPPAMAFTLAALAARVSQEVAGQDTPYFSIVFCRCSAASWPLSASAQSWAGDVLVQRHRLRRPT